MYVEQADRDFRPTGGQGPVLYRIVDEHDGETLTATRARSSKRPLSLGELTVFLAAWPLQEVLEGNGFDRDGAQDFTRPSSEVYPQFEAAIRARIDGRYAAGKRKNNRHE